MMRNSDAKRLDTRTHARTHMFHHTRRRIHICLQERTRLNPLALIPDLIPGVGPSDNRLRAS